ncbi:O-antigen ligase family protein [Polynucleobacter sp. MWH-P3-07-1]|uniref:O-antigen ligase family protein n=1 Tax=Polynucleobacter sp. MWH-P3-07-1 TaxID=1743173 RepID=UPI001BFD2AB5|nr:O-antigen ligase family protein [Polynucleobacter sp. MWH-P3-07-1]
MHLRSRLTRADFLLLAQAILFAILFAIWALPKTIFMRNLCLGMGAFIGLYQIYACRTFLANKKITPLYLIIALFFWAIFHLLFLSNNFTLQWGEFQSIWKRSLIGVIFAVGFGLSIPAASFKVRQWLWPIFYLGLLLPTLIYILKFGLLYYEKKSGLNVGAYWHIYVAKTAYMGFCIPVLAVALGQIYLQTTNGKWLTWSNFAYACTIPAVLFVFYAENIKNGVLYSFVFTLVFIGLIIYRYFKAAPIKILVLVATTILGFSIFIGNHIKQNHSWETFLADAKVATQAENSESWKCQVPGKSLPINELGEQVSDTNYSRVAWGINALKLIPQYPLGYGLVERSFGHIGKEVWPDSCLTQSHSGWLDLTLGIGIPGMLLIFGAIFTCLKGLLELKPSEVDHFGQWRLMALWTLMSFVLIWCTAEISQKVFFDEMMFFIALSGGLLVAIRQILPSQKQTGIGP